LKAAVRKLKIIIIIIIIIIIVIKGKFKGKAILGQALKVQ
jgi:hypothetical protein